MEATALKRRLEGGPPLGRDALLRSVAEQATLIRAVLAELRTQSQEKAA